MVFALIPQVKSKRRMRPAQKKKRTDSTVIPDPYSEIYNKQLPSLQIVSGLSIWYTSGDIHSMSGSEFEGKKDASSHIDRLLHYTPGLAYLSAYRREWFRSDRIAGAVVFTVLLPSNLVLGGFSRISSCGRSVCRISILTGYITGTSIVLQSARSGRCLASACQVSRSSINSSNRSSDWTRPIC